MRRAAVLVILTIGTPTIGTMAAQRRPIGDPGEAAEGVSLADNMLAAHNAVRGRLGVPALVWSERLAGFAQEWANTLAARGQFFHRPKSPYGENLFEITGASAAPVEVVNQWASESRNYQYRSNSCRGVCGHYTQIVWRDSKRVGCAAARSGRTEVWVCNYDPPGNWIGKYPY